MLLHQIVAWEHIKKSYKDNKFKISAPTQNEEFRLIYGSYSAYKIQGYFKYFIKKLEAVSDNPPIRIHVNKLENRITFRIKIGYYLELSRKK